MYIFNFIINRTKLSKQKGRVVRLEMTLLLTTDTFNTQILR